MTTRRSFLIPLFLSLPSLIGSIGCGGNETELEPETAQSIRAETPPCGSSCPSTCFAWVHVQQGQKKVTLWIFHADQLDATSLRAGTFDLESSATNAFKPGLSDVVPQTVPATVEATWNIPGTMDPYQSGLTAKLVMSSPNGNESCGLQVDP